MRWSGCGARGRICSPLPGGLGPALRHYDRSARSSLHWGRKEGTSRLHPASQETRPEAEPLGWITAWREPRWSAERRARSAERAAAPEAHTGGNIRMPGEAPRDSRAFSAKHPQVPDFLEAKDWNSALVWIKLGRGCVARTGALIPPAPAIAGRGHWSRSERPWWRGRCDSEARCSLREFSSQQRQRAKMFDIRSSCSGEYCAP